MGNLILFKNKESWGTFVLSIDEIIKILDLMGFKFNLFELHQL